MKSKMFLLSIITLLLSNSLLYSQAALKKGVYSLGGSISYSHSKNTLNDPSEIIKSSTFGFQPSFSYFVIDNLSVGGSVSFIYNEIEFSAYNNDSKAKDRQFGIGPIIRYYFETNNIAPFLEVSGAYSKDIDSKQEGKRFNISGGFDYFLSNSVGLEPFLSYSISHFTRPDQDANSFSIGIRINYFIIN